MEIRDNGDGLDALVMDLGYISGVLSMIVNLNQSKHGGNGDGGERQGGTFPHPLVRFLP